jgi:hypothetical protein
MGLNTRIRGAQIKLNDTTLDVATDSFAFYDVTDGIIKMDLISDVVTAIAGNGLSATSGVLAVEVDNVSLGFATGGILEVLAGGISDAMLVEDYVKVSDIDGTTLEVITGGTVQIADGGVDASKLSATGGIAGQVLTLGTGDDLNWTTLPSIPNEVFVDDVTVEFLTGNILAVKTAGISHAQINAGSALEVYGAYLCYDGTAGGLLSWIEPIVGDDTTIQITLMAGTGQELSVIAGSIDASFLSATGGSAGQVLTKGTGNTLSWETPSAITEDYIQEAEIVTENHSADILETGFAGIVELGFAPVLGSVQVFLNGLLQEEGSGKDYTIGGTGNKIVTFDTAPVIDDIVIIHYIKN